VVFNTIIDCASAENCYQNSCVHMVCVMTNHMDQFSHLPHLPALAGGSPHSLHEDCLIGTVSQSIIQLIKH